MQRYYLTRMIWSYLRISRRYGDIDVISATVKKGGLDYDI